MKTRNLSILCALLLLSGCATQAPLTWDAERIAVGSARYTQLINKSTGETVAIINTEKTKRLISIKNRLASASGQNADLFIMDGKEPNAGSTPNNGKPMVAVNLGMFDLLQEDDDAFAAVIGHELAHLALGHRAIREQREGVRTVSSSVLGLALSLAGVPGGNTIADLGTQVVTTAYSRDEERDADRHGIDYMKRAGFNPQGAVRAWERMSAAHSGFSIPFLSTHPQSAERLETMKRLAAE